MILDRNPIYDFWPLDTARCGDCDGTGSITIAPPDQADTCPTCEGLGEVEDDDARTA